ncbi:MAG: hypothetical protein V3R87_03590 [Dehalococcoidia bacterium]
MNKNYSKYRLVLGGDLIGQFSNDLIKMLIKAWADESGVRNVSSGVVRVDMDQEQGAVIYSVHFDSSHWTGIGFKGFDVKNPGVPQTL